MPLMGRNKVKRQLLRDDIGNQGRVLLNKFIWGRFELDQVDSADEPETPPGPQMQDFEKIISTIKCIADIISQKPQTQSFISTIISRISQNADEETFLNVASDFFPDGVINWERVVTLFHFCYEMALQELKKIPLMGKVIDGVTNFIKDRIAPWIIERGGWESVVEYFGTPTWQAVGVFGAGLIATGSVIAYNTFFK